MPSYHYATRRNRCIHCSGTHASEDHHLSLGIPIVSNPGDINVLPHQETKETSDANLNTLNDYKTKGQPLPSQQSAFLHAQWMLPPLTLHTMSQPSMEGNNSQKSTTTSRISSITSHIYNSMPPPPSHQVHSPPTATSTMQSSQSSRKSTSASKCSNNSSTQMMGKSSNSTRNQRLSTPRTGEHSHGKHSQTGSSHNHQTCHQQMRNESSSRTATGSTRAHGKPVKSSKRVCLSVSDFFSDESQDVEDIYGDGTDDVYNNIN